jgi:hypothetical protein
MRNPTPMSPPVMNPTTLFTPLAEAASAKEVRTYILINHPARCHPGLIFMHI